MNYIKIETESVVSGDGLRVVLWLSGCSHHCKGCQNPQTWNSESGILFDENAKKELFRELEKDYISGITFSGGDPLNENNLDGVLNLIKEIKVLYPDKTIWLYTGYIWEEIYSFDPHGYTTFDQIQRGHIVSLCDVLVDGEYIDDLRDVTLKWRGSKNQKVINVKKSILQGKVILHCD